MVAGTIWKGSFNDITDLNTLDENIVIDGWTYYIKNENDAYIVINNLGDYRPSNWTNTGSTVKSFLKIADYTELSGLVTAEKNRAEAVETTNATDITSEVTRATGVEGALTNLTTNNKNTLVEAINDVKQSSEAAEGVLTTNLNIEISRAEAAEDANTALITAETTRATSAEDANTALITAETTRADAAEVANLALISAETTRATEAENLKQDKNIPNEFNKVLITNNLGNIITSTNITKTELDNLENIDINIKNTFDNIGNINIGLPSILGRNSILDIMGTTIINNDFKFNLLKDKYSYGPSSLTDSNAFNRDGYYPVFINDINASNWKLIYIDTIIDNAISSTSDTGEINKLNIFKSSFNIVNIGKDNTIDHLWFKQIDWGNGQTEESIETLTYVTIKYDNGTIKNPQVTYLNNNNENITLIIILDNIGTFNQSIIGDISTIEAHISLINTKIGISNTNSGSGADILGKLNALGNVVNFQMLMNDRTLINVIGELSNGSIWDNSTILEVIGDPNKISTTDITSELQKLGVLSDYSISETLNNKIGNLNNIPGTKNNLLDYIKAIGNIDNYSDSNTFIDDIYTKANIATWAVNIKDDIKGINVPQSLNSLEKLANAINNDSDYSTTIFDLLATKQNKNTGDIDKVLITDENGDINSSIITKTQLEKLNGIDVNIKNELDNKQNIIIGDTDAIIDKVLITQYDGSIFVSTIKKDELEKLNGIDVNIKNELDNKQNTIVDNDLTISKTLGLQDKLDDIGILFQNTFNTENELDNLTENNVLPGNVFYINENKRTYIVINNPNGDYKPNNWSAKSFLILVNYSELQNSIANLGGGGGGAVDKIKESLDYYISINSNGTIFKGGNLGSIIDQTDYLTTNTPQIAYAKNHTINEINIDLIDSADNLVDINGITWLRNNYDNNGKSSALFISNINTENYLLSGYSVAFYITNPFDGSCNNIFTSITTCTKGLMSSGEKRLTHMRTLLLNDTLEMKWNDSNIDGGDSNYEYPTINTTNNQYSEYGPRWDYDSNDWKYTDQPLNDDDVWFICITISNETVHDNYNRIYPEGAKYNTFQISYKRTSKTFLNQSILLTPQFTAHDDSGINTNIGMSRFFDEKAWFIFGSSKQKRTANSNGKDYFNLEDFTEGRICSTGGGDNAMQTSRCNTSEIMVFNKILDRNEIQELSDLSPIELQTRFR